VVKSREVSDTDLAVAVEADLVAHVARLYEPPEGEVHRVGGAVWFVTGLREAYANGVLRSDLSGEDPGSEVDRLLAPFRSRSLPMSWWVFAPIGGPARAVDGALRSHGFTLDSDRPGMGLDLAGLRPAVPPAGATVERVRDAESFGEWGMVVGRAFQDQDFSNGPSVRAGLAMGFGDDVPFRHYLCRIDGAPVGASTLSLGAGVVGGSGVAGLANIATVPERRGRGIGVAVAGAALQEARALGLRIGALSADQAGIHVYEKLGFHAVSRHLTYVWHPPV
jgi:GNAT superfamily N-acetyltransferase